jgi:anti-sigma regulatory factor (Ser/Thr protein kinase)
MNAHRSLAVHESSQAAAARSRARALAERAGFDDTDRHRVGLVATELATNLVKHATRGGDLLMRIGGSNLSEVELVSLDRGPGIRDVARSLADGHSTAGSPGTGLGAVHRMSDDFDIYSSERGTAVLARLRSRRAGRPASGSFDIAAVSVAVPGELLCGDAWRVRPYIGGALILVVDGLGHGVLAHEASEAAVLAFDREQTGSTTRALESIHLAIRHTRGAAAAVADLNRDQHVVRFAGVGNISAAVCVNGTSRQAVSNNGTLGHVAQHFREFSYPLADGAVFVMHSDGVSARWSFDQYPGLRQRDPLIIAATLYRDFSRTRDDATVLVARGSS